MAEPTTDTKHLESLSSSKKALLEKRLRGLKLGATDRKSIAKRPDSAPRILSSMQQRLWYLDQLEPNTAVYNIPSAFKLSGDLEVKVLELSINEIIKRHEILRTRYRLEDENIVQVIDPVSPVALPIHDLPGGTKEKQLDSLNRQLHDEARRPFNLSEGPLFRIILYRLSDSEHVLFFMVHHIAFDGWSFRVLLTELTEIYEATIENRSISLPELSIQYADYAHWHQQQLSGDSIKNQMDYWLENLSGELPILNMPADFPRPAEQSVKGSIETMHIEPSTVNRLVAVGQKENATLFMVLLAAFKILLFRYTLQKDLLVGTPIANRTNAQTENMIGFFANTLVLRSKLDDRMSFWQLLLDIRETCLNAFSHPDAPFERLVEELNPERDMSITPVFQVMFAFQTNEGHPASMSGITIRPIDVPISVARTDLSLWIDQNESGLNIGLEYCTDLFSRDTITRLLDNFKILLEGVASTPDKNIAELPLLSENEKIILERELNATDAVYPADMCLHEVIESQCNKDPERKAVLFGEEAISYQELNERSNQLANFLRSEGIGPDIFVGICLDRSIEMVIGVLGVLKSGGAYLPLDPDYPTDRLQYMVEDSGAPVVITQSSLKQLLPFPDNVRMICIDDDKQIIDQYSRKTPESVNRPDNLAYIIYTSGSTGKPKGVQVPHRAVVNFLFSMSREPGMKHTDLLLAVTTLSFDIHVLEIFLPLIVGAQVVIADRETTSDGNLLLNLLNQSQATIMQATPSTWRLLLAAGWTGSPNLKILCGGEAFPKDLLIELLPRVESVWNMYGPTETTVWSSCCKLTDAEKPILIGRPIANTQIYILDKLMQPVPVGVPGELHIGGDGVTRGYLNRPELTEKQFVADPFHPVQGARIYKTGDLARFRSDGNLEYLSRIDTQVKVRGFRIELGEIESVLSDHPSVDKCVTAVREDSPGDVRLVGYIVAKHKNGLDVTSLRNHLRIKLPDYMVPQHFVDLEALPLTPAGKVDRKNLPAPETNRSNLEPAYVAPNSDFERAISAIWQDVLKIEKIGINDNFFDLGGHSLRLAQVHNKLRKELSADIKMLELFRYPTISSLADYLSRDGADQGGHKQTDDRTAILQAGKNRLKQRFKKRQQGRIGE